MTTETTTTSNGTASNTADGISVTRMIPFPLSDESKARLGEQLACKLAEKGNTEAEKRTAVASANETLKALATVILELSESIRTSTQMREVKCLERPGIVNGMVEVWRTDTGELLETIPLDEADGEHEQPALPFVTRPGKACEGCGLADGNHRSECFVAIANGGKGTAGADEADESDIDLDGAESEPDYETARAIADGAQPQSDAPLTPTDAASKPLVPVKPRRSRKASVNTEAG